MFFWCDYSAVRFLLCKYPSASAFFTHPPALILALLLGTTNPRRGVSMRLTRMFEDREHRAENKFSINRRHRACFLLKVCGWWGYLIDKAELFSNLMSKRIAEMYWASPILGTFHRSRPSICCCLLLVARTDLSLWFLLTNSYYSYAPYSLACAVNRNLIFLIIFLFYSFLSDHVLGRGFIFHTIVDSLNYLKINFPSSYKLYPPTSVSKRPISRFFCNVATFAFPHTE